MCGGGGATHLLRGERMRLIYERKKNDKMPLESSTEQTQFVKIGFPLVSDAYFAKSIFACCRICSRALSGSTFKDSNGIFKSPNT